MRLHLLPHVGPDSVEVLEVGEDVLLRSLLRRGSDDHAAAERVLLAKLTDDAAQPAALFAAGDLARDADVIHGRHEDEKSPRQRHVRGQARALRAKRLLGDLHENFLSFFQQVLDARVLGFLARLVAWDARNHPRPPTRTPRRLAGRLLGFVLLVLVVEEIGGADDVGHVEEAVAFEADVDECRLHAGQHLRHAALVDVARDAAIALALDENFCDEVVLENRHTRLVAIRGNDHFFVHGYLAGRQIGGRSGGSGQCAVAKQRHAHRSDPLPGYLPAGDRRPSL